MRQTIRMGVFETNSSSSHSLIFIKKNELDRSFDMMNFIDICEGCLMREIPINMEELRDYLSTAMEAERTNDPRNNSKEARMQRAIENYLSDNGIYQTVDDMDLLFDTITETSLCDIVFRVTPNGEYYAIAQYMYE